MCSGLKHSLFIMEMNKSPTCDVHKANPHWQPLSSILTLQNTEGGKDMCKDVFQWVHNQKEAFTS